MTTSTNGDNQPFEQRLESIESRLDRLEGEFRDQAGLLLDGLRALSAQTTFLANRQQQLAETMVQLARNAEADRAIIRENQTEIRRIWEYLLRQSGNGQQPT
ncbi:hypothetical protein [Microseira wollei]|uniref:Uncharacterized protein n=1 Tax=Microseira wollei NIES-4236 TaxID=2530354 RepID=A0AAV3XLW8_9CYAN|nr:hypothetical protein [Microseira wollei]GET43323.1 hypothetical protein MiSe_81450 [Microseira wollei NIES-4236]